MKKFKYLKISNTKKLRYIVNYFRENLYIIFLPGFMSDIEGEKPQTLLKFAQKNKVPITNLKNLYNKDNLYFFSLEFEEILNTKSFKSKNLFNFHFSLLPKYRGCHTNYYQILNGEKKTGVTVHKIDRGIDTGMIIDSLNFKILSLRYHILY